MNVHKVSSDKSTNPPTNSGDARWLAQELKGVGPTYGSSTQRAMPSILDNMSAEERHALNLRLRRKIDIRLLPMMFLMYILNYLDRNNIASARLAGLEKDLNLQGDQFQTSVSVLFVGYLLMQGLRAAHMTVL
jgi:hypothetical protein